MEKDIYGYKKVKSFDDEPNISKIFEESTNTLSFIIDEEVVNKIFIDSSKIKYLTEGDDNQSGIFDPEFIDDRGTLITEDGFYSISTEEGDYIIY